MNLRNYKKLWSQACLISLASVALVNVGCQELSLDNDLDSDGIPDQFEMSGETYQGLPLHAWGARPGQTDLFVEIDYMDSTNGGIYPVDEGLVPNEKALQKVVDVFAAQGIAIHFDVGDLFDRSGDDSLNPTRFDLGGGQRVAYARTLNEEKLLNDYRANHLQAKRQDIFYYQLFVNTIAGDYAGWGGYKSPNSMVAMAKLNLNTANAENTHYLINNQALMIMHELGHNLGLLHGGRNNANYKPNYISVMNYLYASDLGIPVVGSEDEATRYYFFHSDRNQNPCSQFVSTWNEIPNSIYSESFRIDFSHGGNAPINERAVSEVDGLGGGSGVAIDFDCDGTVGDAMGSFDVSGNGFNSLLKDHDDWSNLYFYHHFQAFGNDAAGLLGSYSLKLEAASKIGVYDAFPSRADRY